MTSAIVLDTSAYSQLRRGHGAVLDQLSAADGVLVPAIVIGELHARRRARTGRRHACPIPIAGSDPDSAARRLL